MAFNGNFMCTSFKKELLSATHNFTTSGGDAFQIALYTNSATFTAATTAAPFGGGNNEVSTSGTYTAGGPAGSTSTNTLAAAASMPAQSGTTAFTDFADKTFTSATITARGALIYNSSAGAGSNTANCVLVLDFGSDKASTSGDFKIVMPSPDASNALIRIA
tara:strand:- start:412 stop:897 length:486 start_codon:yes stop_codon:yes gene_type:complete